MIVVQPTVQARLDQMTRDDIAQEMTTLGIVNVSSAVRILIRVGLDKMRTVPETVRFAAFREGVVMGAAAMKRELADATDKALQGADAALQGIL